MPSTIVTTSAQRRSDQNLNPTTPPYEVWITVVRTRVEITKNSGHLRLFPAATGSVFERVGLEQVSLTQQRRPVGPGLSCEAEAVHNSGDVPGGGASELEWLLRRMILSEISAWIATRRGTMRRTRACSIKGPEVRQHCDAVGCVDQHQQQDQEREHQVVFWGF